MIGAVVICRRVGRSVSKAGSPGPGVRRSVIGGGSLSLLRGANVFLAARSIAVSELPEQEATVRSVKVIGITARLDILGLGLMFLKKRSDREMALATVSGPLKL